MDEGTPDISRTRVASLADWLAQKPGNDYERARDSTAGATRLFFEECAHRLEPALNARIAQLPQATYEDKKELSKWINHEVRMLGLSVACPKTGLPAYITGHPGNDRRVGRFVFHALNPDGTRTTSYSVVKLPPLRLVRTSPETARGSWVERTQSRGGPQRDAP